MAFQRILVPVDFTDASLEALDYALDLARRLNAWITVLHVYTLPTYTFLDGMYVPTAEQAAQISEAAQRGLDSIVDARRGRAVAIASMLCTGLPPEAICAVASGDRFDLIVMGTHGRGGVGRAFLGSVANAVIRNASVPVVTVRRAAG